MNPRDLDLASVRAQKARLAQTIDTSGFQILLIIVAAGLVCVAALALVDLRRIAYFVGIIPLISLIFALWYKLDLSKLKASSRSLTNELSGEVLCLLVNSELAPQALWSAIKNHWQVIFFSNHLLLPSAIIESQLSRQASDMPAVWQQARLLAQENGEQGIEPGHLAASLLLTSPNIAAMLTHMKLSPDDVTALSNWLQRGLEAMRADKPYFGGIGRDWANGFTPLLNQFGYNISLSIEQHGSHFGWLTESTGVQAIKSSFSQGASAVALVGNQGVGKTSHMYALAQVLLEEKNDRNLEHRQIMSLNASVIMSAARYPGELEHIVMNLLEETVHAGHIILFLDDAQLFFQSGPGSFDVTQILLPVIQSRAVQLVLAMTPRDFQLLKANNPAFAGLLTPVVLSEPPEQDVMRILEDTATSFEVRHKALIAYEALREAYRLSGRYNQDTAYPGKAIALLEQALTHADANGIVTVGSVQAAIEQATGVKVGTAAPAEADTLLHLEDEIHKRMINQTRAVSVVSSALRRARAGVGNPRRPIGSFLFLGPTGVGKTELAKAIAATYFGAESNMIRLDMSEYQQPEDVARILSAGEQETSSLILRVRQQPFSVVLLDEIEKAHPNILNLLLQLLDEGQLTDVSGRSASFKDCIIIATSNAGANSIRERVEQGQSLESFENEFTDELINSGQFKPELLNRFDEIVLFRPLNQEELAQIVNLMLNEINQTLSTQKISVELTPEAVAKIVAAGYDARLGARPMRRVLQRAVEDTISTKILKGEANPGDHLRLDAPDLAL